MTSGKKKKTILFVCTANACRSQMAEGWADFLKGDVLEPFSAGVQPARISEKAIEVMKEAGVDISKHYSKHIDDLAGIDFDYVVTLCDSARQVCPVFPKGTNLYHSSFPDPASVIGTQQQVIESFRAVRDKIRDFVEALPEILDKND